METETDPVFILFWIVIVPFLAILSLTSLIYAIYFRSKAVKLIFEKYPEVYKQLGSLWWKFHLGGYKKVIQDPELKRQLRLISYAFWIMYLIPLLNFIGLIVFVMCKEP
jgi:hypothetical protein